MDQTALGRYLRDTREEKELTLEDAWRALRIRASVLASFESGHFNVMESAVQERGQLRNYARYLGLDEERVLALYDNALNPPVRGRNSKRVTQESPTQSRRPDTQSRRPDTQPRRADLAEPPRRRGASVRSALLALSLLTVSVIALGVIVIVVFEFVRTPDDTVFVAEVSTQALGIGTAPATSTFTPTWTPRPTQPTATMPFTGPLPGEDLTINLTPLQRTWVRVISDGSEVYAGILRPGEESTYTAISRLDMVASNAAALSVLFNGQQQQRFGLHGQQVTLVFTSQGVDIQRDDTQFQPTPEISATPQPTPTDIAGDAILRLTPSVTPGPSPTASETLIPSETPIPSETTTLTPFPTETLTPTLSPTPTLTPTLTLTATETALPTLTPTATLTPTITLTPTATAILPPRVTPTANAATKIAPTAAP